MLGTALAWQGSDLVRILWSGHVPGDVLATHLTCLASIPVLWVVARLVTGFLSLFSALSDSYRRPMGGFLPIASVFFGAVAALCLVSKAALVVRGTDWFPELGPVPQPIFLIPASLAYRLRLARRPRKGDARCSRARKAAGVG